MGAFRNRSNSAHYFTEDGCATGQRAVPLSFLAPKKSMDESENEKEHQLNAKITKIKSKMPRLSKSRSIVLLLLVIAFVAATAWAFVLSFQRFGRNNDEGEHIYIYTFIHLFIDRMIHSLTPCNKQQQPEWRNQSNLDLPAPTIFHVAKVMHASSARTHPRAGEKRHKPGPTQVLSDPTSASGGVSRISPVCPIQSPGVYRAATVGEVVSSVPARVPLAFLARNASAQPAPLLLSSLVLRRATSGSSRFLLGPPRFAPLDPKMTSSRWLPQRFRKAFATRSQSKGSSYARWKASRFPLDWQTRCRERTGQKSSPSSRRSTS